MKFYQTLKAKITLIAIVATLICFAIFSACTIFSQSTYIEKDIESLQKRQLQALNKMVKLKLGAIKFSVDELKQILVRPGVNLDDFDTYKGVLQGFRAGGDYVSTFVHSLSSANTYTSDLSNPAYMDTKQTFDPVNRPWYKAS